MGHSEIASDVLAELSAVAEHSSCELLRADFRGGVLRLTLDREEGVTLADCEKVSKLASALLDVRDFGRGRYVLEVSSPGIDRELYGPGDYERFVGSLIRVTITDPGKPHKETLVRRLVAFATQGGGRLTVADPDTGDQETLELAQVQIVRLEPEA